MTIKTQPGAPQTRVTALTCLNISFFVSSGRSEKVSFFEGTSGSAGAGAGVGLAIGEAIVEVEVADAELWADEGMGAFSSCRPRTYNDRCQTSSSWGFLMGVVPLRLE